MGQLGVEVETGAIDRVTEGTGGGGPGGLWMVEPAGGVTRATCSRSMSTHTGSPVS